MSVEYKNKVIYWGGIDNTVVPKMKEDIENLTAAEKIQKRLLDLEKEKKAAQELGARAYRKWLLEKKKLTKELGELDKIAMDRDMMAMGLKSKLNDLQKDFVKVTKEGGKSVFTMTQEFMKQGFHTQKNLKYRVDMAGIMEGLTHFTEIGVDLLEDETGLMDELSSKGIMVGETFGGLLESQHKNLDISKQLHSSYKEIGKAGFSDLTNEAKKQYEQAKNLSEHRLKERRLLTEQIDTLKSKGKLSDKDKKNLDTMLKARTDSQKLDKEQLDTAKANLETAERFKIMSQQSGAAVELISGPLDKAKSTLESMPFGKFISDFTGLGDHMETFKEGLAGSFKGFMDEENTIGRTGGEGLFNAVTMSANKMINDIQDGFGRLPGLLKTVNAATSGMLGPLAAVVAIIAIAGKLAKMFYGGMLETRKEFGLTFAGAAQLQNVLNTTAMEFKMMGVSAEDVKAGAQGIMDNLGGIGQVTRSNVSEMARLNALYGVSGESAGLLAGQMMAVGVSSVEGVGAQLDSVAALSQANGVAPAKIMEDVASNSEAFAGFAKDGGDNVFKAAIAARKLGLGMSEVSKISDHLLDFESSINAEMEASMLLGRSINMDKAREAALNGDLETQMKEITKQVGSQAEWESLNVVQRRSLAAAAGLEVSEMSKMIVNQEKLNNMTSAQVKRADLIASLVEGLGAAWTAVMESLKPIIPLAVGILSPILLIVAAFAGVIVIVGKVLAMFNKLSAGGIGLGDVVMFIAGAFISYKLAMMAHQKVAKIQQAVQWMNTVATQAYNTVKEKGILLLAKDAAMWVWSNSVKIASTVATWAATAAQFALNAVKGIGILLLGKETAMWVWSTSVKIASTVATWAATAAQWALNAAMAANPIGLIILGVIALVAVIVLLFKKFNLFPKVIGGVMKVFSVFKTAVMTALKFAFAPLFLAWEAMKAVGNFIGGLFGGEDKSKATDGPSAPTLHSGGMVTESGFAQVKKGEAVLTEQQQGSMMSNQEQGSMMSTQAMEGKLDELIQLMGQQGPIALGVNQTKANTGKIASQII